MDSVTLVNHALVSQVVPLADLETLVGLLVKHGQATVHAVVATLKARGMLEDMAAIDAELHLWISDTIAKFKAANPMPESARAVTRTEHGEADDAREEGVTGVDVCRP